MRIWSQIVKVYKLLELINCTILRIIFANLQSWDSNNKRLLLKDTAV